MTSLKIRSELAAARIRGINIAEILHSFGVEKSTELTADQYPAVMEKIDEAWLRISIQRILEKPTSENWGSCTISSKS